MRPLKTIIAGTLALLAAAPLSAQTKAEENKKPNILFIITDDHAYQTLGSIQVLLERREEAAATLRDAYALAVRADMPTFVVKCAAPLISNFTLLGRPDSVRRYISLTEPYLGRVAPGSVEGLGYKEVIAQFYLNTGRYGESLRLYRELLAEEGNLATPRPLLLNRIARAEAGLGRYAEAYRTMAECYAVQDSVSGARFQEQLSDFSARYDAQQKELEIATLREERALQRVSTMRYVVWSVVLIVLLAAAVSLLLFLRRRQIARGRAREREFEAFRRQTDLRLARKYIDGLEAERTRLARELHDGICSDLRAIVRMAHDAGMLCLADEAHGTHFYFGNGLPVSAMAAGADMASVSMHKSGGSLTQSSLLLIGPNVHQGYVRQIINLTQTTSGSYLLMSSLDISRRNLALRGRQVFHQVADMAEYAREEINAVGGYYAFGKELCNGNSVFDFDTTKLSVHTLDIGLAGIEVYDILRDEYDIQIEFGDIGNILAYLSIGDRPQEVERLVSALAEIKRRYRTDGSGLLSQEYIDPVVAASPQEAFYAPKKSLPLRETEGMVCSEFVMCYPPGIPILAPGERITKEILNYIEYAKAKGCSMTGPEDPEILHLNVLA